MYDYPEPYNTTGVSTSADYIKSELFDYLCSNEYLEIDGVAGDKIVEMIRDLAPTFDINDVTYMAIDNGIGILEAIQALQEAADEM